MEKCENRKGLSELGREEK